MNIRSCKKRVGIKKHVSKKKLYIYICLYREKDFKQEFKQEGFGSSTNSCKKNQKHNDHGWSQPAFVAQHLISCGRRHWAAALIARGRSTWTTRLLHQAVIQATARSSSGRYPSGGWQEKRMRQHRVHITRVAKIALPYTCTTRPKSLAGMSQQARLPPPAGSGYHATTSADLILVPARSMKAGPPQHGIWSEALVQAGRRLLLFVASPASSCNALKLAEEERGNTEWIRNLSAFVDMWRCVR